MWSEHSQQPINISEKRECGHIQGLPRFFWIPSIISGTGESMDSNLAGTFTAWQGPSEQRPINNFGKNGLWTNPGTAPIFWVSPITSRMGKTTKFKFCTHILSISRKKSPLKISGKVAVGIVRDSRKFSGHSYIGHIMWSVIFAIAQFSCYKSVPMIGHLFPFRGHWPRECWRVWSLWCMASVARGRFSFLSRRPLVPFCWVTNNWHICMNDLPRVCCDIE